MNLNPLFSFLSLLVLIGPIVLSHNVALGADLKLLFLGDQGPHHPVRRFEQLAPVLAERGIDLVYTDDPGCLNAERLHQFDGLILYANLDQISPESAQSLLDYVSSGHGFLPLHCASFCFRNSPEVVNLIGGQFKQHGTGAITTVVTDAEHPVMRGFSGFQSWDESYVHTLHHKDNRTVLESRVGYPQAPESRQEPWTWVRSHGKGRVFYTAWGHDERTWGHPGFQNLIERGIRWACGQDPQLAGPYQDPRRFRVPEMTALRTDLKPFQQIDVGAKIPAYVPEKQWGTQAAPRNMMQVPLSPEESRQHFVTPVDFKVSLFVSEEDLQGKPIAMNWDERGRLWICETVDYPNELQQAGTGNDRIRICEDTDGDGRADRFTVFAEKLSIPTAIVFARGGAIVQNGTETLFLKDTTGDDRADVRVTLISNWTLGDTHGGVSHFRQGLDNWIWGMQGYNNSAPVINGVEQQSFRQGFFRFRLTDTDPPQVAELEFVRSTDNNTWGLGISEEGLIFGSTANRNPSVFMPIPNRYYERVHHWSPQRLDTIADTFLFDAVTDKIRQVDHHGGYTAGAGHALYTGRSYPRQWWNQTAFVCEPTGHLVGTFLLHPDDAGFHSTSPCNLLASDDEWSSPIMAEVGPDGQVWVIDWYNYIIQHNPTPHGFTNGKGNAYESDLRDKKHGRVYRVVYQDADAAVSSGAQLKIDRPDELIAALGHPTLLCRLHAQRLLIERGKADVVPKLLELVQNRKTDEIGLNVAAIHALWTLKGLNALDHVNDAGTLAAFTALSHPSAGVRRNALQVLPATPESTRHILAAEMTRDVDSQVRLAALLALADAPADLEAGELLARHVTDQAPLSDRWIRDAVTSASAVHHTGFFAGLAKSFPQAPSDHRVMPPAAVELIKTVARHVAGTRPDAKPVHEFLQSLNAASPQLADLILDGFSSGWPKEHSIHITSETERLLIPLFENSSVQGKAQLVRLARNWGTTVLQQRMDAVFGLLIEAVKDDQAELSTRLTAAQQLIEFDPDRKESVDRLLELISLQSSPDLTSGLLQSLTASTASNLGEALIQKSRSVTPGTRTAMIRVLLSRPQSTGQLLTAVEQGELQLSDLSLEQRQALSQHPNAQLKERALALMKAGGGLPNPDREKVVHEKLPLTTQTGDVNAGKLVFEKHCLKCHTHQGQGEKIGPDLTGMAVHPKSELLIHLLDPSRSVEGNFRSYSIVTIDGRILNGMLAGESRTSIELIDAEAKRHVINRDNIDELHAARNSLMPDGFEKQLSDTDLVNLLEFLTDKGPFLPLPIDKVATITTTKGMFYNEDADAERLIFDNWQPKTFNGIPFILTDPRGNTVSNAIMLNGPLGKFPPAMPKSVLLPCHVPAKAIHLLSGVSGWGAKRPGANGVTMIVRLHFADGTSEDHELIDGQHFADYIGIFDVPKSQLAFKVRGQQVRFLTIQPRRKDSIDSIEFVKGQNSTAPVVMAVTIETGARDK